MDNDVVYIKLPVAIDKPIAGLIKKLNKYHLVTSYCCAGHKTGTVVYFVDGKQVNKGELLDETNLYIAFSYTDNTRKFLKYFKNFLQSISFQNIIVANNKIKYISNSKNFNRINIEEEYDNDFVIRIHYNTDNFEKNQAYCIKFLTKIVNNYLKNNK